MSETASVRWQELSLFPDLQREWFRGPLVPSVVCGSNADLIRQVGPIHLAGGPVLDVTYGKGLFWSAWTPPHGLTFHDLAIDGVDFTALPYAGRSWHAVVFDPPYIPAGGALTSTAADFQDRYGLRHGRSQADLDQLVYAGLSEVCRVAADVVAVKCMDYVNSGRFTPNSYCIVANLPDDWQLDDEIVHHAGSGPGGHNIEHQRRVRRCHSKLLILRRSAT